MQDRTPAPPLARRALAALVWALAAAGVFAFQLPFFDRWFSFMDEGHLLQYADLIANGGELYRDATVYPLPGSFWLLAAAFRIFEPTILLARWIVVIEYTLFVLLVLAWLRRLVSPAWLVIAYALLLLYRIWSFPHWHMYSYSSTALLVLLGALLLLLRFFESGRRRWLMLAGLAFGFGVLCKQDYGAAALLAVAVALPIYARSGARREPLPPLFAAFLAPAALVGAAAGLHFWRVGLLGDVLQLTVFNHFVGIASYEYPAFPDLFPLFGQDPALRDLRGRGQYMPALLFTADWRAVRESWLYQQTALYDVVMKLYYYGPYLLVLAGGLKLVRRRAALRDPARRAALLAELLLVAFAAALMLLVTLNRPQDYVHLIVLYWPLIALAVVLASGALAGRPRAAAVTAAVCALPFAVFVLYSARLVERFTARYATPIDNARAGVRVLRVEAKLLEEVVDYVRENSAPGEAIAVMPYYPIVHFLAERPAPHRSTYIVWPFPELPDRDRQIVAAMRAQATPLVVYNFTQFAVFPVMEQYAPELFEYLIENYELERIFSYDKWGYILGGLRRTSEPPAGRALLAHGAGALAVAIESPSEPPRPLAPDARATLVSTQPWPFRPTLALRPSAGGERTVARLELDVPERARLLTAVGVNPQLWHYPPIGVAFELAVVDAGEREVVYSRRLSPTTQFDERGWLEVDVPLARWAGRFVTLELSTAVDEPEGETLLMAGWAQPRLLAEGEAAPR
jgi:hypothetical protein